MALTAAEVTKLNGMCPAAEDADLGTILGAGLSATEVEILDGATITTTELNRACDVSTRVVNTTANLALTEALHDSKVVTVNKSGGAALTLPAASGSGAKFDIIVGTTVSASTMTIKVANANDVMTGVAINAADGGDTAVMYETASTTDTITFDGSTTGGIKGDRIELIDIASNLWYVRINGSATGSEATPFSATVS